MLCGIAASSGVGVGRALIYREADLSGGDRLVEDAAEELERYHAAVEQFCVRREEKAQRVSLTAGPQQAEILRSQAVMIRDPYLNGQIEGRIASLQCAEAALRTVCGRFIETFSAAEDEVTRLRAADVRDLRDGMLRQLLGLPEIDFSDLGPDTVLLADELPPSAASSLDPANVCGIVLRTGGRASHCAILARALEIPAVMGVPEVLEAAEEGELLAVDGSKGCVYLGLTAEEVRGYEEERDEFLRMKEFLRCFVGCETAAKDGTRVQLAVNVSNENDVLRAEEYGCDGVGLFRSEYLYQERDALPDEEEQFRVYRRMALAMKGRPLVIRSLDVGGDKELPCLEQEREDNPFLGCRGLRLCLREEEMFLAQLRAVLRAGAFGDVRLMLPMVAGVDEVRRVKALLEHAKAELRASEQAFREDLPLGVMIETPAAALTADLLARETDFFSIGTNDLTQYTMAVDRGNSRVAYLYSCYDPAVLRALRYAAECGHAAGIPVAVCGEAAADPLFIPVLLGLGIGELSVHPAALLATRRAVSLWTGEEAAALVHQAMTLSSEAEVHDLLEREKRI